MISILKRSSSPFLFTPLILPGHGYRVSEKDRWGNLMRDAQDGDQASYEMLLNEIAPAIEKYCHRRLHVLGVTEDCVQETILAIHKSRQTYDPSRPFQAWMYAIVKHKVIEFLRRETKRVQREIAIGEDVDSKPGQFEPSSSSEGIVEFLKVLPAIYRDAIILLKFKGLTTNEAAKELGISPSALKVRASRGYRLLRKKLEPEYE